MEYREAQQINNPLVIAIFIFSVLIALFAVYIMLNDLQQQGENVLQYAWVMVVILIVLVSVFFFVFKTTLETDVSEAGFGYRYFPILPKRRVLAFSAIKSWRISQAKLFELGGFGYKRTLSGKKSGYIMHLNGQVEFVCMDGKTIIFSIRNKEMMRDALRKYMADKEVI